MEDICGWAGVRGSLWESYFCFRGIGEVQPGGGSKDCHYSMGSPETDRGDAQGRKLVCFGLKSWLENKCPANLGDHTLCLSIHRTVACQASWSLCHLPVHLTLTPS